MNMYMCKPDYFDVIHKDLNVHMKKEIPVDKVLAGEEYQNLVNTLTEQDVEIQFVDPKAGCVDQVFAANAALLHERSNIAVLANFTAEPRREETQIWSEFLDEQGFDVRTMSSKFEGQGDALFSHNCKMLWVGNGFRSEKKAANELQNIFSDTSVISLTLVNPMFYHLDTCFCPLENDKLLFYSKAFDKESLKKIYDVYDKKNTVDVSGEDAMNFACNAINVGKNVIMNKPSWGLIEDLDEHDFNVIKTPMSQFLLSGGSTKCTVLISYA